MLSFDEILHTTQTGLRRGASALAAGWRAAVEDEINNAEWESSAGISLDFRKAYDSVKWSQLERCLLGAGIPESFVRLHMHTLRNTHKCFKTGWGITECWQVSAGLPQGCPVSCILLNLYVLPLLASFDCVRGLSHASFADDIRLWSKGTALHVFRALDSGLRILGKCSDHFGLMVNASKTIVWGSPRLMRARAKGLLSRGEPLPVLHCEKVLGISINRSGFSLGVLKERVNSALPILDRLRRLPIGVDYKVAVAAAAALTKALSGAECISFSNFNLVSFRNAVVKATWGTKRPFRNPFVSFLLHCWSRTSPPFYPG